MIKLSKLLPILLSSNTYNRGIARLDIDEFCYLYHLVESLRNPQVIEIGTYKGGSTILFANAGANVITIDNYSSKTFNNYKDDPRNPILEIAYGMNLDNSIQLLKADSRTYSNKGMDCDILFIDGDHSYEGVKADYNHWIDTLVLGGHLIFHDSCIAREGATGRPEVMKFMKKIPFKKVIEIGSLTHFKKEIE